MSVEENLRDTRQVWTAPVIRELSIRITEYGNGGNWGNWGNWGNKGW